MTRLDEPSSRAMRALSGLSLRMRMSAMFAIVIFTVAGALSGLIGRSSTEQMRARISQSLANDAARLAERMAVEVAGRLRELALIAAVEPLDGARTDADDRFQAMLDGLKRSVPAYRWIGVTNASGHVVRATDPAMVGSDISVRMTANRNDRSNPKWGMATGSIASSDALKSKVGLDVAQGPLAELSSPVRNADGVVLGMIFAELGTPWLRTMASLILTPDNQRPQMREATIVNSQDQVLLGPADMVGQRLVLPPLQRAQAGIFVADAQTWPDGTYLTATASTFGGVDGSAIGTSVPTLPVDLRWTVLVREQLDAALAPATELGWTIFKVGAALAMIFALAGWLVAGWITAPLRRIALAAERLRRGEDAELPRLPGPPEIASLAASLRSLIASMSRKQIALDAMEEIAQRDPLTGLLNRHGLRMQLDHVLREIRMRGTALLIFVLDLDGFKTVNDELGHACGDELLRLVGRRLSMSVRPEDLVARIGGDEFVLALRAPHGFNDGTAREIAERALAAIGVPFYLDGGEANIGCSLGGACWPEHVDRPSTLDDSASVDEVIRKADAALYEVKRNGKGRVLLHGDQLLLAL